MAILATATPPLRSCRRGAWSRPGTDRHYDGQPPGLGRPEDELVVTVIDWPVFGPDGVAPAATMAGSLLRAGRPRRTPDGSTP
jgi:hypothetical protein